MSKSIDAFLKGIRAEIDRWRHESQQSQAVLAKQCGIGNADLVNFLGNKKALPLYALANLASTLKLDVEHTIADWECCQCVSKLEDASKLDPEKTGEKIKGWELARDAFASRLSKKPQNRLAIHESTKAATLVDWPRAFASDVVVFVGDRRETPPKSPADLLAVSGSMGDLFNFCRLALPPDTEIRSDKTSVTAHASAVSSLLRDKHLLVIGSPAANLMARTINSGACFSFYAEKDALADEAAFRKVLEPIRYLPGELEQFAYSRRDSNLERSDTDREQTPEQKEWARRRRNLIYAFARSGILDPVHYVGKRAKATNAHTDYGLVSLCRHPWSDDHVAIMVAGLHGPGTAAAVKLLSEEGTFARRPLGGVFRVNVPVDAAWEERYRHLSIEWDTHEYSIQDYESSFESFTEIHKQELNTELTFWNPTDVRTLLKLITLQK